MTVRMAASIPPQLLERIWFYTNFDCSLRCRYCVTGLTRDEARLCLELPLFRRLVDEAVTLGFRQAALTGGEPFQHPDTVAMIDYATARIDTVVLTNAHLIASQTLDDLKQVDRSRLTVQVSLDSADPAVNDQLRGQGSWQKTMRGLEQLLEAGYVVSVRATLDGQGKETLCELTRLMDTLGVPAERVYGAPVAKVGLAAHGLELSRASLYPEPTIVSDGLYWHPLLIDPPAVLTTQLEPLESALEVLVDLAEQVKPVPSPDVR
jgi:MoaA/NifB/PqqE/SkfB family radical SAM enzyme